jgi:hypothetical protein
MSFLRCDNHRPDFRRKRPYFGLSRLRAQQSHAQNEGGRKKYQKRRFHHSRSKSLPMWLPSRRQRHSEFTSAAPYVRKCTKRVSRSKGTAVGVLMFGANRKKARQGHEMPGFICRRGRFGRNPRRESVPPEAMSDGHGTLVPLLNPRVF